MSQNNSGLEKNKIVSRLMHDVSVGVGVAAFAVSMWGMQDIEKLLASIAVGVAVALLVFAACYFLTLIAEYLFPSRPAKSESLSVVRVPEVAKPEVSKPQVVPEVAKPEVSEAQEKPEYMPEIRQEKPPKKSHGIYSVHDVEPRTVSIAAEPLPTPPFPDEWSEQLIETLEWKVFDDLCIAFWEAQGNSVLDHSKGTSDASNFFISAKNRSNTKIGVVQSRSSQANKASVIEMQNLLRVKQQSELPIAIFMYAGRISNVVSSYCQSHGIRLFGSHNITKGITALPEDKQEELMKTLIQPDYMIPTCPNCTIKMVKRKRKDTGRIFWGCLSYPECRETIEYSPYF